MPTSVLGAHSPPWQSASWRNTPSRSTEKPWPSPGHGSSVSSPHTPTTPPKKLPRLKKWKTPMVKMGFQAGINHSGLRWAGIHCQSFFFRGKSYVKTWWFKWRKKCEKVEMVWKLEWEGEMNLLSICVTPWWKWNSVLMGVLLVERACQVGWISFGSFHCGFKQESEYGTRPICLFLFISCLVLKICAAKCLGRQVCTLMTQNSE